MPTGQMVNRAALDTSGGASRCWRAVDHKNLNLDVPEFDGAVSDDGESGGVDRALLARGLDAAGDGWQRIRIIGNGSKYV